MFSSIHYQYTLHRYIERDQKYSVQQLVSISIVKITFITDLFDQKSKRPLCCMYLSSKRFSLVVELPSKSNKESIFCVLLFSIVQLFLS